MLFFILVAVATSRYVTFLRVSRLKHAILSCDQKESNKNV